MAESRSRGTLALKIVVLGEGKSLLQSQHSIHSTNSTNISPVLHSPPNISQNTSHINNLKIFSLTFGDRPWLQSASRQNIKPKLMAIGLTKFLPWVQQSPICLDRLTNLYVLCFEYSSCGKDILIDKVREQLLRQTVEFDSRRHLLGEDSTGWSEARQTCDLGHSWPGEVPRTRQDILLGGLWGLIGLRCDWWGLILESHKVVQRAHLGDWTGCPSHHGRQQMRHHKLDCAKGRCWQLCEESWNRTCADICGKWPQCWIYLLAISRE